MAYGFLGATLFGLGNIFDVDSNIVFVFEIVFSFSFSLVLLQYFNGVLKTQY